MKQLFTSLLFLLSAWCCMAQYQYSNNGFESWDSNGEPTGWNSYPSAGGNFESTVKNSSQITSTDDAHSGSKAVKLMARSVIVATANGMLTTGQIQGNSMSASDPTNNNISDIDNGYCMPFTGKPDSMALWLKMSYSSTSQRSRIHILLHDKADITDPNTDWTKVVAVAGENAAYSKTWKRYSVPFYYKGETLAIDCDNSGSSASNNHTPASSSARPSYVLATIATNYMAGKGNKNDVLLVDDVVMIYNSSLKSVKVNGTALAGFSKTTYSYTVNADYKAGCLTYQTDARAATVTESYDASTSVLTLTVKGDDYSVNSSNVHTYKFKFNDPKVYGSLLTSLKVNGTSVASFSSATTTYKVTNIAYANATVTYTASEEATVEKSFDAATNVLTLTVKGGDYASNSANVHVYKITFHAPFESLLTSLKVNGVSVANFSSATTAYKVTTAAYATSTVDYTASSEATVEKSFDATTSVLTLTVKGGDYATNSANVHVYKITFHAPFESLLTSLKVNGTSVTNFSSATTAYKVTTAAYATSTIDYTASSEATVEKSFDATTNVLTLTVKGGDYASNSANVHVYKITFHAGFESLLTSLKVNGASVANFSSATTAYKVTTAAYANSTVDYTASSEATVEKSFDSATNVLTLTVKGGDYATNSANVHVYKITFHAGFESLLTSLKVNGVSVANFSSATTAYKVTTAAYATSTVDYTASSEATVEKSFDSATNVLTLTVKGGDYATNSANVHVYKITFHAGFESLLTSLKVNGVSVANFSSATTAYKVTTAAYATSTIDYTASSEATVEKSFDATTNVLTLTVKGGDYATNSANVHVYKITFHAGFESLLTSLKVNGASVVNFSSATTAYKVTTAAYATSTIDYTASSEATVEKSFDATTNVLTLTVKGGDYATNSTNVHVYKITFHAGFESLLTSLKVNGASVADFSSATLSYVAPVVYADSKVTYTASEEATVEELFDAATHVLTLTVKGGDYATHAENIHRYQIQFYASSYLAELNVDGLSLKGFDRATMEYSVDVTYEFSELGYAAEDTSAVISKSYDEATATLSLTVSGSDVKKFPDNTHVYQIHYHLPYTAFLASLSNNGTPLAGFSATQYSYVVDEVYSRSKIQYSADEYATVEESFDATTNVLTLTVKGGDVAINPKNLHTYTVKFHAPYTSLLSDLKIDGTTVDGFAPDQFEYVVDGVYFDVKLEPVADEFASYAIRYDAKSYVLSIRVESGDIALAPTNYHTYKIQFNDHNVYLSQLLSVVLNGEPMVGFDKDKENYEIDGSYADITFAYTRDSLTTMTEEFDPTENTLKVTVVGGNIDRDPANTHTYTFSFTQQFAFGAQITAIYYDGVMMDWFDKDTYEYSVDLDFNRAHFSYTTNSLAEVYEFFDDVTLTLSVIVIGGDMDYSNMNEYTIHFTSTSSVERVDNEKMVVAYSDGRLWMSGVVSGDFELYSLGGKLLRGGTVSGNSVEVGRLLHGLYVVRLNGKGYWVRVNE